MEERNKILAGRFYNDAINKGDVNVMRELMSENFIDHNSPPEFSHGIEGFDQFIRMVGTAFPDLIAKVDDIIAEGEKVAVRLTITGTQTGILLGSIPPSGKKAMWTGIDIL